MANPSKIHFNLAQRLGVRALGTAQSLPVIVRIRADAVGSASVLAGLPAPQRTFQLIPAHALGATPSQIDALSERDEVDLIWYDDVVHTALDVSVPLIGAPGVWQAGYTGKGIKIGIADTGVDDKHPDLVNRIAQMRDFTGEGTRDNNGHGTHVAGIIGSTGAASGGKYRGVAPECSFYVAKVLLADGSGKASDVMAGIDWAVGQGVQIVNLSVGGSGPCDGTDALSAMCDAAVARGVVMCVAAGNLGPAASTVGFPGCAKSVITVGATDKSDQIAPYSSRGPTSDQRVKPDICFPGVNIVSCLANSASYTTMSGTSMATPMAAGACALLLQADPSLPPQQVKDMLMRTAKNLNLDPNTQGAGRGDVLAAFDRAALDITAVTLTPANLAAGQLLNVSITVRNGGATSLPTQGPDPGFVYDEGDTFVSRGFADIGGNFRVGIDFDNRSGIDHPYRWGLGAPLAPGQSVTITGAIRLKNPQAQKYWAGLVQEHIAWAQDHLGTQTVTVQGTGPATGIVSLTNVTFSPATLQAGELLNVSIMVLNGTNTTLPTQGPDPGFVYDEGDTFATRGFAEVGGNFRVGIDFDNRVGMDHPYRWGLGTPLGPGETRVITGAIRLKTAQSQNYWAGLVQEHIAWILDRQGIRVVSTK